ncbi:uncharacterized protein EV154DRAFT_486603 [Mucor mucedo]|uniref:uncharacterized protein n=1 Tax=Mucor mucedo TaxID=29922 RepID=UPI00221F9CC4|nr:uncharacterized protein EV154DRAFT_486603 [Mucor mucedo]KAI7875929.1 hypothetical protein EV154DRAFT_486603 [Mucor mucedo]
MHRAKPDQGRDLIAAVFYNALALREKIECNKCKGAWMNINRIDYIEDGEEGYAEIRKKTNRRYKSNKEGQKTVRELKFSADVEVIMEQDELAREKIACNKCGTIGTIQKNGRNQEKPPKPHYKCKLCEKGTTFAEMKTILKYETPITNEKQMEMDTEDKSDFADDDENDVSDIVDTEMEQDGELAGKINVWNEMKH